MKKMMYYGHSDQAHGFYSLLHFRVAHCFTCHDHDFVLSPALMCYAAHEDDTHLLMKFINHSANIIA